MRGTPAREGTSLSGGSTLTVHSDGAAQTGGEPLGSWCPVSAMSWGGRGQVFGAPDGPRPGGGEICEVMGKVAGRHSFLKTQEEPFLGGR